MINHVIQNVLFVIFVNAQIIFTELNRQSIWFGNKWHNIKIVCMKRYKYVISYYE